MSCVDMKLLAAAGLLALAALPASAQGIKDLRTLAPAELMPGQNAANGTVPMAMPENEGANLLNSEITVAPASNISLDTLGIYDASNGGVAFDVWKGSSHAHVRSLLENQPQSIPSPTVRQLLTKLLLSSTRPPQSENIRQNIFRQRVETLMRLDELPQAQRLLERVPQDLRGEDIARMEYTAHLLQGDADWVCSNIATALTRHGGDDVYWQKLSIFCNARKKDEAKVMLALDLLSEQQMSINPGFVALVEVMTGRSKSPSQRFSAPLSVEDAAMIALSGQDAFPEGYLQAAPLPIARLVQQNKAFPEAARQQASQRIAAVVAAEKPSGERAEMQEWFGRQFSQSTDKPYAYDRMVSEMLEKGGAGQMDHRRAYRFHALLEALGFQPTSAEPWKNPVYRDNSTRAYISPALRAETLKAAAGDRKGEAILLVAMAVGQANTLAEADDATLADITRALRQVGYTEEARAFAAEAMAALY